MRVLFLHPNFPGQFRHIAAALAAEGHDVAFLCQTHYGRQLPGVKRLCMKGNLGQAALDEGAGNQLQRTQRVGKLYRRAMAKLDADGWQPDAVVSHSGFGCGLHVKELWPQCRHISYLEWWFDPQSDLLLHDPHNRELNLGPDKAPAFWLRNQPLALELVCADAVVAPTQWQRTQLPPILRKRCHVVYEMMLHMKQSAGQRDVQSKLLLMDEVSGFHYVVKVFHAESVVYTEENGLVCHNPKLLVTWQLRPGLVASATSVTGTQRKRVYMSADTLDFMNSGEQIPAAVAAAAEEQEETQAELEATDEHNEAQAEPAKKKKRNA